ncbi:TetR/AcrR family transcriptional regulator [Labrys sp. KNU-23]|uniref:TetR/AcrR family transcriptional regulator n=1 Tax=Labrys sp. KNU-23 TaxID=2789216 RepID=UPI0011F093BA|nr:helix-turn-helix domain-containing protein [Labrys sp. KNU-23]QEN87274.1 TetR/AcrR family transcriptional regulator [Labrys sp. KNU-23]
MPRHKTLSDETVLEAALRLLHAGGPEALTFAGLAQTCGLAAATLVQRFGSKARLKQAALLHAWDRLDQKTAQLAAQAPRTPEGAIDLLVALSGEYGGIESYAEGLLILREDLRDPLLRARGARWRDVLVGALDVCLAEQNEERTGLGLLMATQWQGSLAWWGFEPKCNITDQVERDLKHLMAAMRHDRAGA